MPTTLQFHRSSDEADRAGLIRATMVLDRELYGDIGEEHLGSFDYWVERFARCPEFLSLARNREGALVGYYQFIPVTADFRDRVLEGRVRDGEIPLEAIVPYAMVGVPYHLYLCSMVVRPEWRGRGVASRLYREEVRFQQSLRARGCRLGSLVSVVWSPCGNRFFQRIGLPRVGFDEAGRPVHYGECPEGVLPEIRVPLAPQPAALAVAA